MATETNVVCDVFTANPRLKLDDVRQVEIRIKFDDDAAEGFPRTRVMCANARKRLLNGVDRLLKPPTKREKGSDG